MNIINWNTLDLASRQSSLARPAMGQAPIRDVVADLIRRVREGGDDALRELTLTFDGCSLDGLSVSVGALQDAESRISAELGAAIREAAGRIESFHAAGQSAPISVETAPGLVCEARQVPIQRVGLYIPGGSAPLISTVLMLAIPARLAECPDVVLCTPPDRSGEVHPALLYAAYYCGVRKVIKVGGAQAVAAMAYGTESVPACRKIFGPGNAYVTEAKRQVSTDPMGAAQDMPAGPSEVMVIADASADPESVCWDLLSQAEHGPDSQSLVVSDSAALLDAVREQLPELTASQPRASILEQSLQNARLILVRNAQEALAICNEYAPEHLILNGATAEALAEHVVSAGSVFIGPWTPESLGDYSSGTNHVLPTYGHAHAYSGLSVADFQRRMTMQRATREGIRNAGPATMELAAAEGLEAHRQAVACRLRRLEKP